MKNAGEGTTTRTSAIQVPNYDELFNRREYDLFINTLWGGDLSPSPINQSYTLEAGFRWNVPARNNVIHRHYFISSAVSFTDYYDVASHPATGNISTLRNIGITYLNGYQWPIGNRRPLQVRFAAGGRVGFDIYKETGETETAYGVFASTIVEASIIGIGRYFNNQALFGNIGLRYEVRSAVGWNYYVSHTLSLVFSADLNFLEHLEHNE